MQKMSKKHQYVLYSLKSYLQKLNRAFEDKPLEASVSKIYFIRLMKELAIVEKSERGLYKNLEFLEKKKYISYENRFLKLTEKGLKAAREKDDELSPYMKLIIKLNTEKPSTNKSTQTYFK